MLFMSPIRFHRPLVRATLCILLAGAMGCAEPPPPSIILVSIDTLRSDALGAYGRREAPTPTLDRLAAEGVLFADVITQSTNTGPSHRAILTGVIYHAQDESTRTLPGILRQAGYDTAAFVDGGYMNEVYGHADGFDLYVDTTRRGEPAAGPAEPSLEKRGGFAVVLPRARRWIEEQGEKDPHRPFFLFLHTYDVHCPYGAPPGVEPVHARGLPRPDWADEPCRDHARAGLGPAELSWLEATYLDGVRHADRMLGEFLEDLRRTGALRNATVIVVSDHGESLGERGWIGHTLTHASQLFVPWIMAGPGLPAGRTVERPAQLIDLVPTVLDYLGLPPEPGAMGLSLMPAVRAERVPPGEERLRFCELGARRTLVKGGWALEQQPGLQDLVYEIRADPLAERGQVAGVERTRTDLLTEYLEFLESHDADLSRSDDKATPDERTLEQLKSLGYVN